MDITSMQKIGYGIYVLTANDNGDKNGCIINTLMQVTSTPAAAVIAVNKQNKTCGMIERSGKFGISVLTEETPFDVIKRFGFASGRDTDKLSGADFIETSPSGLAYLTKYSCARMEFTVKSIADCGTHILFTADMTDGETLSDVPAASYSYYHKHIKPKPQPKKGWVCKICGYIYEGDELPEDFICPWCKHSAADFERVEL
ncbi:MAG: flavin reductase [Oscillospiraceae bacterium]